MELEMKELKIKSINTDNYLQWTDKEILLWIMSIDNQRFAKYETILSKSLSEQCIIGEYLCEINENDILGWGIKHFRDKKILHSKIKELVKSKQNNNGADNEGNFPPTAYIQMIDENSKRICIFLKDSLCVKYNDNTGFHIFFGQTWNGF